MEHTPLGFYIQNPSGLVLECSFNSGNGIGLSSRPGNSGEVQVLQNRLCATSSSMQEALVYTT